MEIPTLNKAKIKFGSNFKDQIKDRTFGEYQEKSIHAILKHYYESDIKNHEVRVGRYIADIKKGNHIIEIQTRGFHLLKKKLEYYSKENYKITIVHPLIKNKWITWIGENKKERLSPIHASEFSFFKELYKIKEFLNNQNINFSFIYLDIHEYKKRKQHLRKGISMDRIPLEINNIIDIKTNKDYFNLIANIEGEFTSKSLSKMRKANIKDVRIALNVLFFLGVVQRKRKEKNAYVYVVNNYQEEK